MTAIKLSEQFQLAIVEETKQLIYVINRKHFNEIFIAFVLRTGENASCKIIVYNFLSSKHYSPSLQFHATST